MNRLLLVVVVLTFSVTPLWPQEMGLPKPASELSAFKSFLGNWQGSGTVTMVPGAPPMTWTCKSTWQYVLGGHFLREEQ